MKHEFKEVEFKYEAQIPLKTFVDYCEAKAPVRSQRTSGYDHFYGKTSDSNVFCRHRVSDGWNELTFKRKLNTNDNFIRDETNLQLHVSAGIRQVSSLLKEFGYEYNTTIFKNCFIYQFDTYNLVFYVIYDEDLQEKGRFIEIEAREDYPWNSVSDAWSNIVAIEKTSKELKLSANNRTKLSLWEMFKKGNKV